ncbi:MAG TPA: alanine racemase [Hyphomonadaceae bacterium]|nr:alanine racemase [Hyphomonadaceae bacterium]HPI48180.1 alanine racemase [Hyphomonadaceae bacterium]
MSGASISVDLGAVVENWRLLARRAAPARTAAVVKANGYGLGAARIATALAAAGARRFYVAWPQEGAALRAALGPEVEIAVFHGADKESLPLFREADLQPVINTASMLALWLLHAKGKPYALHVDTGMNRLGLSEGEWPAANQMTTTQPPSVVLSHLARADEPNDAMNDRQLERFWRAALLWPGAIYSLAATAGIYLGERFHFSEVRPGIGLYGGGPVPEEGRGVQRVIRITAPVLQTRNIGAGESVGYGGAWRALRATKLAVVGIGYADGFLRSASNKGHAVIAGEVCPIVGRVSMDTTIVDVTGIDVQPGDEAELVGPTLALSQQADAMSTIDYEFLTRIGQRVLRDYRDAPSAS